MWRLHCLANGYRSNGSSFFFDFKENASGRFLRITEDVGGHRDTIIIPATGLELIREAIDHAIKADKDTKM